MKVKTVTINEVITSILKEMGESDENKHEN